MLFYKKGDKENGNVTNYDDNHMDSYCGINFR